MLNIIMEGLTQPLQISSNGAYSLGLLLALSTGPLPLASEHIIGAYLALQLMWWLLLCIRAARAAGSQSARRELKERAKEAYLKWMDGLRFSVAELICHHLLHFEFGAQVCMFYCGTGALRTVARPLLYVILRLSAGSEWATRLTGYNPAYLLESVGCGNRTEFASGPAWKQHGHASGAGVEATSAQVRVSSLAPTKHSDSAKNNNNRCTVLDEGPHFNRTSRGCMLKYTE
ncbi:hypothetical protein conserved [Leishmania donovani]|uniref:Uncharacterized protein n=3 Tax=Leishmania donovani species complex TaxID=38574 RepID=A4IA72_LEIIN|nr:hypothetical protein, unknown function [Leishmania infantum JPCM5]XP_003864438.1 hypothetical protein, unknown function [Leishmania donovani]CAC9539955.1 hypothetical_protein_-_conserved [Leishmania infantum]AYU82638.1 hypothetical protein LdCL_340036000 [Leishmania donovani]TPP40182.1 hypothetical protein CGC21_26680 [Leishmania donovani]TPP46821.1 hypothetical protein CGC20_21105 [Leishmania donovani]CAJ1992655.1 hypothetical protein conserved [Leishmania donovani]|eukprot:XP_001468641.1 hypothetical protein, unknown function [Leishmania infantum JPCM5]